MKKNYLFGLSAMAAMLFVTSCQEEDVVKQAQEAAEATVSINVTTPEMGVTRAFGDGETAQRLHYAVYNIKYDADGKKVRTYLPDLTVDGTHEIKISTTVDLQLVTGNEYDVIFWADADAEDKLYTLDWETAVGDPTVSVNYDEVVSNNESYDAFYGKINFKVDMSKTVSVTLKRPFAQLNVGTSDIDEAASAGYVVEETEVLVESYKTLHLWEVEKGINVPEAVSNPGKVHFNRAAIPARYDATAQTGEKFPVDGYEYLAMNYILRPADKDLVDVEFNFYSNQDEKKERTYASVPLQRNWRTNIYGQLITSDVDVNVTIDPIFSGAYNIPVWDGHTLTEPQTIDGITYVGTGAELAFIANAINGGGQSNASHAPATRASGVDYVNTTIKLTENIDLGGENWTPIAKFEGTFDGNGFTISNLNVRTEGRAFAGLFAFSMGTIKNLTVKDAVVEGHYSAGVIVGHGLCAKIENCHVENAAVLSTPYNNDDANNVGGIVGYLCADGGPAYVKNSTVKNAEITAYRKVGGVAGVANGSSSTVEVTGNKVEYVTVVADFTMEYKEGNHDANVGAIVGCNVVNIDLSSNTVGDDVFAGNKIAEGVYIVDGVYEVWNVDGLKWFRDQVNNGNEFEKKTVKLVADIDLNNEEWAPIGNSTKIFKGTFDGNEKTIKNLSITGYNSFVGLFGYTRDGEIKNLTVENAKVSGRLNVAVVAGCPYTSKYTNITVKGHVEVNGMAYVGAVGGKNAYTNWNDITVDVDASSYVKANSVENGKVYRTYVGGVVGFNGEGGHTFKNIRSNINVSGSTKDVGGMFGIAHYGNQFENCVCTGNVEITNATEAVEAEEIGGIAGVWSNGGADVVFTNCSFEGKLTVNVEGVDLTDNTIVGKAYSDGGTGKLIIDGKTTFAVSSQEQLAVALNEEGNVTICLAASEKTYEIDLGLAKSSELAIIGIEGTTARFKNYGGQNSLPTDKFDKLTISNCIIGRMLTKNWGHLVFGASKKVTGVYTISNCIFNGVGTQGIYINENTSGATYNILNCTFNGDFGSEGAITVQNNTGVDHIVNVKGCTFDNVGEGHKIYIHYNYDGWTLNTDESDVKWGK